jgi:hypothetical protein
MQTVLTCLPLRHFLKQGETTMILKRKVRKALGRTVPAIHNTTLAFAGTLVALAFVPTAYAATFDVITKLQDTSAATVWRIDEPNVQRHETSYPGIRFLPGDRVSIDAGGCVQTGGLGRTWKRYVNPLGANSDHLYHGLIQIPGITRGLERLQQFGLNTNHQIPSPLPAGIQESDLILRLGYEDNNYSDNGYWSHDDGNFDQCKNSKNAFVIVSIGHDGALPPQASSFVGITPDKFRCQAAWAFKNFDTSELSWSSFTNAFSLNAGNYLDPATYITFLAARGKLASSGNCAGMALLSLIGEDQFVVGNIKESFWQNYKPQNKGLPSPSVALDINTAHWKQVSAYFLHHWLGSYFNHPATNAAAIEHDLTKANYNYGLLSLAHGGSGHVLVPLRVSHAGSKILIDVYDPNRPCGSIPDTATYPQVVIENGRWSYDMGGKDGVWSGSNGLAYIPYVGQDGWSDLGTSGTGILHVIFGADVNLEQVSDSKGRKLFLEGRNGEIDFSPSGLGQSVMHVPMYGAETPPKRPRSGGPVFKLDNAIAETPAMRERIAQFDKTYAADYGGSGMVFVVTEPNLADLTFTLSGKNPARPVRALVRQQDHFFELRSSASTAAARPLLVVHNAENLAAGGVSVKSADATALKVAFTRGLVSPQAKTVTVEQTAEVEVLAATGVRVNNNELEVMTAGSPARTQLTRRVIDVQGEVTEAPVRELTMSPAR